MFKYLTQFIRNILPLRAIRQHRAVSAILFGTCVVVFFVLGTHTTLAVDVSQILIWVAGVLTELVLLFARLCMALAIFFLKFFIQLGAYNGFLDAPIVRLGWVMLRDIANMFFVVALLIIAFATILGRESYEWKKAMVKLVLVAIVVNFSLLICGLVLDAAHVFTVTFINAIAPVAAGNLIAMFNFGDMLSIIQNAPEGGNVAVALLGGAVLAFFFSAMAALTIGAYCIILLLRMVAIWSLLIFSPLAFVLSVLPATENYFEEWKSEFTKNVLSAPIAVFFLWLAFATMGANSAIVHLNDTSSGFRFVDETGSVNRVGQEVGGLDLGPEGETNPLYSSGSGSVSLNAASTWANMAGFLVAMAFLLKGIEQVQSLGVAGSGWLDSAQSFAKNVVTIGSGYALGRWLVGKAWDGTKATAGEVGYRIPLVGGAALQEYGAAISSTFKRKGVLGVVSGGRYSGFGGMESKITRSEWAKNQEARRGWFGLNQFFGTIAARLVEPAERAQKRAEDWEKAAEALHHVQEESYSTSASNSGQAKVTANTRKESVEALASAKKSQKMSERMELFVELGHLISEGHTPQEARQEYLDHVAAKAGSSPADQAAARKKAKDMISQNGGWGEVLRIADTIQKQSVGVANAKAAAEEASEPEHRINEMAAARARDAIRRKKGLSAKYVPAIIAKQMKELEDSQAGLNFREISLQAARYMAAGGTDTIEKAQEAVALLSASMKRGRETGMQAFNAMLDALGMGAQRIGTESGDREGQQVLLMSALLGRRVDATELPGAMNEFNEKVGGEARAQAILKNLDSAFKAAAGDGAVNMTGLFNDRTLDSQGNVIFELENNQTAFEANRDYFAQRQNVVKLETIANLVDHLDGATHIVTANSTRARAQLSYLFRGVNSNTQINPALKAELQRVYAADPNPINTVLNLLDVRQQDVVRERFGLV